MHESQSKNEPLEILAASVNARNYFIAVIFLTRKIGYLALELKWAVNVKSIELKVNLL